MHVSSLWAYDLFAAWVVSSIVARQCVDCEVEHMSSL